MKTCLNNLSDPAEDNLINLIDPVWEENPPHRTK